MERAEEGGCSGCQDDVKKGWSMGERGVKRVLGRGKEGVGRGGRVSG